jgi:hypothetical protein
VRLFKHGLALLVARSPTIHRRGAHVLNSCHLGTTIGSTLSRFKTGSMSAVTCVTMRNTASPSQEKNRVTMNQPNLAPPRESPLFPELGHPLSGHWQLTAWGREPPPTDGVRFVGLNDRNRDEHPALPGPKAELEHIELAAIGSNSRRTVI